MNSRFHLLVFVLGVAAWAPVASGAQGTQAAVVQAQTADASASLEELIRLAHRTAPSVEAQRARLAATQAALPAAGVWQDPMVEFEYRDAGFPRQTIGSDPMSMAGVVVRQPILSGQRRTAQQRAAAAEVGVQRAATSRIASGLTAAIRSTYAQIYQVDRERAVLADASQLSALLATTAAARYASGESDQASVLRAQLEQSRVGERQADLEAERTIIVASLNRLVGRPPDTPVDEIHELPPLPPLPVALDAVGEAAAERAADVAEQKAMLELAGRRVESAQAELGRSYTLGGGLYWQGGFDRVVTLNLGIELPIRKNRRQRPMIAAAEKDLQAARLDLADTQIAARAEAARMAAELRRADGQILRYQSALLPQSSAALDAARASYLGGRGDFAAVLDEFRRWTELRVDLARREVMRFTAHGQLEALVNPLSDETPHAASLVEGKEGK